MFSPPGPDDTESKLKQRLIGAAVLVALAVIIVPMILDFRKDYDHVIKGTNIPPKPDDFHVEVVPLTPPGETQTPPQDLEAVPEETPLTAADSESSAEESPVPATETRTAPQTSEAATVEVKPLPAAASTEPADKGEDAVKAKAVTPPPAPPPQAVKQAPEPKPAPAPRPVVKAPPVKADKAPAAVVQHAPPPAVTTGAAWVVQVGSFSNQQTADDLRAQLQKGGYKAFVDEVNVSGVPVHRVRVGPLDTRVVADAIRDKLAIEMKLDTRVFSYP